MGKCKKTILSCSFLLAMLASHSIAEIRLSPNFSSNMVFQRDVPVKLTGWADEGEAVSVLLGDEVLATTTGGGDTPWSVVLPSFPAGSVPDLAIEGNSRVTLTNLLSGDIWVCAGQSNMEMTTGRGAWCRYGGALNEK